MLFVYICGWRSNYQEVRINRFNPTAFCACFKPGPGFPIQCIVVFFVFNSIHILTGYEGNSTFIVPNVPTIVRGNAEDNSWYRGGQ